MTMADPADTKAERLDSWKAIAQYLQRDVTTVRRWEKTLGMPVYSLPSGRRRSVYAFTAELDRWLATAGQSVAANESADAHGTSSSALAATPPAEHQPRRWFIPALTMALVVATAAGLIASRMWRSSHPDDMRIDVTTAGVIARNGAGTELWRYPFASDPITAIAEIGRTSLVAGGPHPSVFVSTSHTYRPSDNSGGSGTLMEFDIDGSLRRTFSFADTYHYAGTAYGPPWAITAFAVHDSGDTRHVAVAAHHYTWDPSIVTILDSQWRRRGTFVHAGWIEALEWLAPNRLVIGGYSEARDGGMIALLDAERFGGQGPEQPGTRYHCDDCDDAPPLKMIVMPRTEVNRAANGRFNRALLERVNDRILARTVELETPAGHADVIYEFSPALDLVRARFSERYWDAHRMLEAEHKLDHTVEACPDRDGPRAILIWEPATGWRKLPTDTRS